MSGKTFCKTLQKFIFTHFVSSNVCCNLTTYGFNYQNGIIRCCTFLINHLIFVIKIIYRIVIAFDLFTLPYNFVPDV
jgi:hypothetical protein